MSPSFIAKKKNKYYRKNSDKFQDLSKNLSEMSCQNILKMWQSSNS